MRTARLVLVSLLVLGSCLGAKLPGHEARYNNNNNNQGQSSANSGSGGGSYWWMNNDVFGGGGGNRPTVTSGNANTQASGSSGSSGIASGSGGHQGGGSYQTGGQQNIAKPAQVNVQQQQFNPNVFTPTQSPHCVRGQDCVRWQLCETGVINLKGKSIPRQQPVPNDMKAKPCGMLGNVCCAIPASLLATQQQLGHQNHVQTSNFQHPQRPQPIQNLPSSTNQNQPNFPRPSQQQFQNQASFPQTINNNNIQPEVPKGPPFSECSASLFCVKQTECNLYNGFIEPQIEQWPGQPFVQINMCTSDTLREGVCCQEPHPEFDPWTERPGQDQQSSGSQQQNFQQQAVGSKPQGQHTQQFGASGQHSKPQGNQGHSISPNRPQTNFQQPNTNTFQQSNQPAVQQPSQAISFPQQNQPSPQQTNQQSYQQPGQNNIQQPSQSQFQQPAQNNFQQQPQTNIQQPSQSNFSPQNNFQQPSQNQFQQPNQNNFQQTNRPVQNPSHNDNHKPNLNTIGLPNPQSTFQNGPNEQFPSLAPHPTCSSGLFCVERSQCNLYNGFIEEQVKPHADAQFIAINLCTSPTLKEGVCCQRHRAPGTHDDGQYKGPGALNSEQQQTFVQQGSRPQQGFNQQQSIPQQSFVPQNTAPQQGFSQQPQQTIGSHHSGVQPNQPVQQQQPQQQQPQQQQQGGYAWQNSDAFQPQVPSYG